MTFVGWLTGILLILCLVGGVFQALEAYKERRKKKNDERRKARYLTNTSQKRFLKCLKTLRSKVEQARQLEDPAGSVAAIGEARMKFAKELNLPRELLEMESKFRWLALRDELHEKYRNLIYVVEKNIHRKKNRLDSLPDKPSALKRLELENFFSISFRSDVQSPFFHLVFDAQRYPKSELDGLDDKHLLPMHYGKLVYVYDAEMENKLFEADFSFVMGEFYDPLVKDEILLYKSDNWIEPLFLTLQRCAEVYEPLRQRENQEREDRKELEKMAKQTEAQVLEPNL